MKNAILITVFAVVSFVAKAQIPQPDPDTTAKHFLIVASIGNLQEISAGQLASQLSKNTAVRTFGKLMATDHEKAEYELLQLSKTIGISLPDASIGGIRPDLTLKNAGDNFDKRYIHRLVNTHRNAVATFQKYATTGKDAAVRNFAQQMLPTLKSHLGEITRLEKQFDN
ncbi:DUF4142 domain-containing protein [Pedobacter sp. UYEF25]